jgi:hypothetical protein
MEARAAGGKLAPGAGAIGPVAASRLSPKATMRRRPHPRTADARTGGSAAATPAELWEDTFIVACLRAGQGDKAARMIERLHRRPSGAMQLVAGTRQRRCPERFS